MSKFVVGMVVGFAIATVGLSGVARMLDNGVNRTRTVIQDSAK